LQVKLAELRDRRRGRLDTSGQRHRDRKRQHDGEDCRMPPGVRGRRRSIASSGTPATGRTEGSNASPAGVQGRRSRFAQRVGDGDT
jgi:hypothetical protein